MLLLRFIKLLLKALKTALVEKEENKKALGSDLTK